MSLENFLTFSNQELPKLWNEIFNGKKANGSLAKVNISNMFFTLYLDKNLVQLNFMIEFIKF